MNFFRLMRRVFRRPTAYERLVYDWIKFERVWRAQYVSASLGRKRELVDALREERQNYFSRKLEMEGIERDTPYEPQVFQPVKSERAPLRTVREILLERGYGRK